MKPSLFHCRISVMYFGGPQLELENLARFEWGLMKSKEERIRFLSSRIWQFGAPRLHMMVPFLTTANCTKWSGLMMTMMAVIVLRSELARRYTVVGSFVCLCQRILCSQNVEFYSFLGVFVCVCPTLLRPVDLLLSTGGTSSRAAHWLRIAPYASNSQAAVNKLLLKQL